MDQRGEFTEVFRDEWDTGTRPVQWSLVSSAAGVLRGVHVHRRHHDYLLLVSGRASIGLCDLRRGSPTERQGIVVELRGRGREALTIPPGVAHGFYFHEDSVHLYSVSHYFDPEDELGCHWADPGLRIPWPFTQAVTSTRDRLAPPLAVLLDRLSVNQALMGT